MREAMARTVWYGEGFDALLARAVLTPVEWVYGAAVLVDGARRARGAGRTVVPTVSIGNLTVGGTGKTPIAAWFASQLRARGRAPAMLLRGYGDDEALVHAALNPDVPVLADADRRRSAVQAIAQGATALVLDDAFQHREMPRDADIVVVSADLWSDLPVRLLPAGPFREPLSALRRAHLVIVTRKAATAERAAEVARQLTRASGGVPLAVAHLAPGRLCAWTGGASASLESLRGRRVLAVSGIGAPDAFTAQLGAAGAQVQAATYGDHHAFSARDVRDLAARVAQVDRVICTLKDAVKLGPQWPAPYPPLWYLSQLVVFETGEAGVEAVLDRLVSAAASLTPASTGPKSAPNG
ncbi:MAG: tetraacyldisaccharide 4'-kinase [Gemmatimonadaceae bacterium]|nr:tetraacyldisaccharide 4'-kinase [Gemmatimonadaceae bacterium]